MYGGFELSTLPWQPDLISSAVRDLSNPIDAIVLPDDFVRWALRLLLLLHREHLKNLEARILLTHGCCMRRGLAGVGCASRGGELGITGDLYYWLNVDFLSVRGKTLILTGGISGN